MKKWLSEELICPECLNRQADEEIGLIVEIRQETDDDILEGRLNCPLCKKVYEISDGIAVVVPE
jgi:uncharacterized protein YbaR (Trm112 family)